MSGYTETLKEALETIIDKDAALKDKDAALKDKDAALKDKDVTIERLIDFLSLLGYDANEVKRFLKEGRPLSGLKRTKAGA